MTTPQRLALVLIVTAFSFVLGGCGSSTRTGSAVQSSGTPVNPFTDPGGANLPSASLTGAQPQNR